MWVMAATTYDLASEVPPSRWTLNDLCQFDAGLRERARYAAFILEKRLRSFRHIATSSDHVIETLTQLQGGPGLWRLSTPPSSGG